MFADLVFFMFAGILLLAALGVVFARNPMSCVMLLILCFLNAAGLFILAGAEFLGLLTVMVYVGAVAVMFLFVLMTIDIDFAVLKEGFAGYMPVGLLVGGILMLELVMAATTGGCSGNTLATATMPQGSESNIKALGQILFTDYLLPFQMAGLILLVAMIGAIVLTHRRVGGVKRQNIHEQVTRRREDSVQLVKVKSGQGV